MILGQANNTLQTSSNVLSHIGRTVFNAHTLIVLFIAIILGAIVGRVSSGILHQLSLIAGRRADKSHNLTTVNHMRRIETFLIMSMALVKLIFFMLAIYVWWVISFAGHQPTAIIGASALALVIAYGLSGPLLRDVAFGSGMMAEQWFGVGDLVTVQPNNIQGVVERVTLRSTKIRGINGETIWYSNQNITTVSVASKGIRAVALELFVSDPKKAELIIEQTNNLLPRGPFLVVSPLSVIKSENTAPNTWHLTVIGETDPSREFLLLTNAVNILKKLDSDNEKPILLSEPVSRSADTKAERQFARAINNARKTRSKSRRTKK